MLKKVKSHLSNEADKFCHIVGHPLAKKYKKANKDFIKAMNDMANKHWIDWLEEISAQKIYLEMLKPFKAPGPDNIPNIVLTKCSETLADHLFHIYKAAMVQNYYHKHWLMSTTIVLASQENQHTMSPRLTSQ